MSKCKITVLKRFYNEDLVIEYLSDAFRQEGFGPCLYYKEGQEFLVERPDLKPDNFCGWAWADLHRDIVALTYGSNLSWIKQEGTTIACCTDGLRPVIFKLERVD